MNELMRSAIPHQRVCPGRCNRAHRVDPEKFEPTWGEPVWCDRCATSIAEAIGALPDLAAALWDVGHWDPADPLQQVVSRQVQTLDRPGQRGGVRLTERLACGHAMPSRTEAHRGALPAKADRRWCWSCALDSPGADGRLVAAPAAGRARSRERVSPAGSPSWLAIDELVRWAAAQVDYLRARVPHEAALPAMPRLAADDAETARLLTRSCSVLVEWVHYLLATPHAVAIGREALDLERRARRASGSDRQPDEQIPGVPCPACDLVALVRSGADLRVRCSSCSAVVHDVRLEEGEVG